MSYAEAYDPEDGVAIVGMAGRFPGARDVEEFWSNLVDGRETLTHFSEDELEPAHGEEVGVREQPGYVRSRGILEDVEMFDAAFFGISPREADILDPQQRVFMECAWEALETAGYDPRTFPGAIGVFAGMSNNSYALENLVARRDVTDVVGWLTTMMGNEKDYLATRVSYKLDLRGPALNIQTACSTSLVAVCAAVQSLVTYQCDMALAGGVSVTLPQRRGYLHQEGGITSPDGHCRAFDVNAAGTVFSNGVGTVTLKRLSDALEDGDTVYAVIKGTALNNDGASKVSLTAPSVDGHAGVISMAQAVAGIDPETISYVEAHGTGTPLGDPVEIAGLTQAFRAGGARRNGYCDIGSVKSNIGHLDAASGVAGLIKTALALHHRTIPPSLHYTAPNPQLGLEDSPFRVATSLQPWQSIDGVPRRAGVSSFGVGGTNAHVVLEEAPQVQEDRAPDAEELIVLSAQSAPALDAATERLRSHLVDHPALPLADVAFTLATGRRRFPHRRVLVARGLDEAIDRLGGADPKVTPTGHSTAEDASVAFLFPGQGAQSVGMARGLYDADAAFRADVDECAAFLRPQLGLDLREVLYPAAGGEARAESQLAQTAFTQPALFVVEYALTMAWRRLGVEPAGSIGHSVGEYVAACLAGVFSRDDALRLVAERGRLMQALPAGAMLAVRAGADAVREMLPYGVEIAAENAPGMTVVSGETPAIDAFQARLELAGTGCRRLATSHAFHSAMMEPALEAFAAVLDATPRAAPTRSWISCLTGDWITAEQAQDSAYWVQQMRRPVLFSRGMARLLEDPARVTLEVGPGHQLTGLAKQSDPGHAPGVVTFAGGEEPSSLLLAAGRLWAAGVSLDWSALQSGGGRRRVALPTYPFERTRHWVDGGVARPAASVPGGGTAAVPREQDTGAAPPTAAADRGDVLAGRVRELFADLSGMDAAVLEPQTSFLELGLDSLFLTQAALRLQKTFDVPISFRALLEDLTTIDALAAHLDRTLPAEAVAAPVEAPVPPAALQAEAMAQGGGSSPRSAVEGLIAEQLEIMRRQLELLRGDENRSTPAAAPQPSVPASATALPAAAFGPYRPPSKATTGGLTERQQAGVQAFIDRYLPRTAGSRRSTEEHRAHLADPRSVAGFRLSWKDLVYPIVTACSAGSRLWDVDGNEYVDLVNGFGTILFGHNPDFVREALHAQLDDGIEIGPQSPMAGEVAARVAAMVGMDRVAFCNTGSEAVTAALRVARTVSGRDRIVVFAGAYHGIFDEVLVRPAAHGAVPIAPGIPAAMTENVVVLEYGSPEALEYLEANGAELAAVLVEPVQSRRPELQPRDFLHDVRRLTEASGTALVFDEVVTGFRTHPGGAQEVFGIRADIATYGKVIGGGLPIGLVAGRREYLDALDGGAWGYGDDSVPEVGVTFFAGTFVRHPLALAAARAVIGHLEAQGPELQRRLNERTTEFAARLEDHARSVGAPVRISHFSSWLVLDLPSDVPYAGVFHAMMRDRGVHSWEGRCWFLTTAHTDADLELVLQAFRDTIAEMQVADLLPGPGHAATAATRVEELPLTDGQQDLVLASRLSDEVSCSYNLASTVDIEGALDVDALRRAVDRLVDRHASLRVTISEDGTRQRIADRLALEVPLLDLSSLDAPAREQALDTACLAEVETPFDLVAGPLIRVRIVRMAEDRHQVLLTVHHAVCDGWSTATLLRHLTELYGIERSGGPLASDAEAPMQLPEYLDWFQRYRAGDAYSSDEEFWRGQVAGNFPQTDLPGDRSRPPQKTYVADRRTRDLGPRLASEVQRFAAAQGCTVFAALLGSFECLLARLTGREDVGLAVTIAGHTQFPGRDLIAHCVSVLPLRRHVAIGESFSRHLSATQGALMDAFEHQNYSLGAVVRNVDVARDPSRMPLVSIIFNMDAPATPLEMAGARATAGSIPRRFENFDVFVNVTAQADDLNIAVTYNTDLFDGATIDRRLEEWLTLLDEAVQSGGAQPVGELGVMAPGELEEIRTWNTTRVPAAREQTLVSGFADTARRAPDAVALEGEDGTVSFGELLRQAESIAARLMELGVGRGSLVGVLCERSPQLVAGIYGVLFAGAAYVPLEPEHPAERISFMVRDTGMRVVLTRGDRDRLAGTDVTVLDLDELLSGPTPELEVQLPKVRPDDLAYVFYTSGSTGRPKGVANSHRGPANLCWWMQERFRLEPHDVALLKAPSGFDMSVQELFWPLQAGARLVVAEPGGHRDPRYLVDTIRRFGVTTATFVPSLLRVFLQEQHVAMCTSLQRIICGGEAMAPELRDHFFDVLPSADLHNFYGPTEAAVWVTAGRCQPGDPRTTVPIGRPMPNVAIHIVDDRMQPLPIGIPGELCIGGLQVAVGYVNREELTAERFVPDPFDPPGRLYRTGDLARWLPDGQLEYLGRMDRQVKFRGQRIELGEIEVTLSEHPAVLDAAVAMRDDAAGDPVLVAYLVARDGSSLDSGVLREYLGERLTAAMIPARYTVLDAFPLTANGKLDHSALPAPDDVDDRAWSAEDFVEPRTPLEREIATMWTEVLAVAHVGAETDFFEIGGHSLKLMQLAARMQEAYGVRFPLSRLFEVATVSGQAELVTEALIGEPDTGDDVLNDVLAEMGLEQ